jgi:putative nucleotidyltransferase with HDIG domain
LSPYTWQSYRRTLATVKGMFRCAEAEQRVDVEQIAQPLVELSKFCEYETNFLHLVNTLRTYDAYTFEHSIGVGMLAARIGEWTGLTEHECQEVMLAGTLHDIGKCLISEQILQKPGRLTQEEYQEIQQHTSFGYMILRNSELPDRIACVAYNHHERMDGNGYPRGLRGEQIDLYSRIVSVADVFNAMTSRRVYRDAAAYYLVLDELQRDAFGELDPQLVVTFVRKMTSFLVGNVVGLNDGTVGTVVLIPNDRPTRPLLRTDGGFLDLQQHPELYIEEIKAM